MNVKLITDWVTKNDPQGVETLSGKSKVSAGTIRNIIAEKHSPNLDTAEKIARAMGITLAELVSSDAPARSVCR